MHRHALVILFAVVLAYPARAQSESALLAEARAAVAGWNLARADTLLEEGLAATPDDASLLNLRGEVRYFIGHWTGAESDFRRAAELKPDSIDFRMNLAHTLLQMEQPDEALALADAEIARDPENATAWTVRGWSHSQQGDLNTALTDYSKAIEVGPDYASAYFLRAQAFEAKGLNERAVQDYTAYLDLAPGYDVAYSNRGLNRHRLGDLEGAIEDFDAALKIQPENATTLVNRAAVYDQLGRMDDAVADYQAALEIDGSMEIAYKNLFAVYWKKGEMARGMAVADRAIELLPDNALGYNLKSSALLARKASTDELDEAATLAGRARELAPDDPTGHSNECAALVYLAIAHDILHSMDNLIGGCETAIELDPDFFDAYEHLAVAYLAMGDNAKSDDANQKADEIRERLGR